MARIRSIRSQRKVDFGAEIKMILLARHGFSAKCIRQVLKRDGVNICATTIFRYLSQNHLRLRSYRDGRSSLGRDVIHQCLSAAEEVDTVSSGRRKNRQRKVA